jgi:hypothetical protein
MDFDAEAIREWAASSKPAIALLTHALEPFNFVVVQDDFTLRQSLGARFLELIVYVDPHVDEPSDPVQLRLWQQLLANYRLLGRALARYRLSEEEQGDLRNVKRQIVNAQGALAERLAEAAGP